MSSAPWNQVRSVLERVLGCPLHERAAVLEQADARVRAEVETLLRHEAAAEALQTGLGVAERQPHWAITTSAAGMKVGPYRLETLIAEGGMGAVYLARRCADDFEQLVAVKLLKPGIVSAVTMRQFHAEQQTLARLEHPYITRLFDGGTSPEGIPYLVMEYVRGEPIDAYCRRCRLSRAERLQLFVKVCAAVEHAHRALIIHRDLKPGNILVAEDSTPKLIDFGIAKLLDLADGSADQVTVTGHRPMTPRYASPEQLSGELVTTASDVYSLGVILHELLHDSGGPPLQAWGRDDVHQPAESVDDELVTIVAKATHVESARRYGSVHELSADIERFLSGHPILARKDTLRYRARKFAQRNRFACAAGVLTALALLVGVVGISLALRQARMERHSAMLARDDAEQISAFLQQIYATANPYRHARDVTLPELLRDAGARVETELAGKPRVEAGVRLAIGESHAGLWQWQAAAQHLQRALELYALHAPENREKRAECLSWLGRARTFTHGDDCVALQQEALRIRTELFGPDHPAVAESKGNLGYAHWFGSEDDSRKNWVEADRLYAEAIAMLRAHEATLTLAERRDLARFTFSYAVMKSRRDEIAASLALFRDAIALYDGMGGSADRYFLSCVEHYAWVLEAEGKYAEAEASLRRSVELTPATLRSPMTMTNLWRLARLRALQGDSKGAEAASRSALEACASLILEQHPEVAEQARQVMGDFAATALSQREVRRALSRLSKLNLAIEYPFEEWRRIAAAALPEMTGNCARVQLPDRP